MSEWENGLPEIGSKVELHNDEGYAVVYMPEAIGRLHGY